MSQDTKLECVCDNCGKTFRRKKSEVIKNNHHFCSRKCMDEYYQWNDSDRSILRDNYRKIRTSEIAKLLSKPYNIKAIRSEAGRLGLCKSRLWSKEEEQIVRDNYSNIPFEKLKEMLPERTAISIRRKAASFNLYSYTYINRVYTEEDEKYLRDNYMDKSNEELAKVLNRTPYAIEQRLRLLDCVRPVEIVKTGYTKLNNFMRARLTTWRDKLREKEKYTCCVTGKRSNIIVHHCRSFNLLMDETIEKLNFDIKDNFEEYTDDELKVFVDSFIELQEEYGEYVCVCEDVHQLFHREYGYGRNTMEQWNEFVARYNNGEFDNIA